MTLLPLSFSRGDRGSFRFASTFLLVALLAGGALKQAFAQSTFASVVGTVKDSTGAVIPGAQVILVNNGTAAEKTVVSDQAGGFSFVNLNPGTYTLTVTSAGFDKSAFPNLVLQARETRRVDAELKLGAATETVTVQGGSTGVITTDVSNLSESKTGRELTELPVAVYSRSTGSTSPIDTLTTLPGVQVDDGNNMTINGTTPALMSYTIDGISSVSVENSGPINELFPSFNSISEIEVSGSNNNAEFSGVADVTTTSKSGTNDFHGGIFENLENAAMNAGNPFAAVKPKLIMNDFGGFVGGPITIPHLYNGKDKSFFFFSYEGLRLPKEAPIVTTVPTDAMRNGDVSGWLAYQGVDGVNNIDGTPLDPTAVPINPVSANFMSYLMPRQNVGGPDTYVDNYQTNFPTPITSNQEDLRIDHVFTPKQSFFVRGTYKKRNVTLAPDPGGSFPLSGSVSTGAFSQPETDQGVTLSYNYAIKPSLTNELRAGFNGVHLATIMNEGTTAQYISETGIEGITQVNPVPTVPEVTIAGGFTVTGGGNPSVQHSNIVQLLDNVTWTKGKHTFKFGGDVRRLTDHDDNVFGNWTAGQYVFDNSQTAFTLNNDGMTPVIGDGFTGFLLGYPDYTIQALVNKPAMNGLGYGYGFFGQDDWKITPRLTLNLGLRYELHPPLKDTQYNTAAFLPTYTAPGVTGAVVVPNAQALSYTQADFAASIAPSPILTAQQAGLPEALRYTYKKDWGPRIGFAFRPWNNDKLVVRGGWGRFIEQPLGFSLVSGWAVSATFVNYAYQAADANGNPTISFPAPFSAGFTPGGASFQYAFPIHYIDPSVQQWNLTVEQDLGHDIGLRMSYIGSHGSQLETFVDINQVPANTIGWNAAFPLYAPFQSWGYIQSIVNGAESNYDSMSVALNKRFTNGLQFQASYFWTHDLSDGGGYAPTGTTISGGSISSDRFHLGRDYGNVAFDRRNRFLATWLYELPFGKNKNFLNTGGVVNAVAGGWQLGGVLVLQGGAFLTPTQNTVDPAGTNMLSNVGSTRADRVTGVSPYARGTVAPNYPVFLNSAAFADPIANSGGFGDAGVGNVTGPGTETLSMSLIKATTLWEGVKFNFGVEASNVLNHRNYNTPDTNVDDGPGAFGVSTALQTAEGAGPRNLQLTARISF
jgi:hypothetical protein